jgi:hypothetical protein
MKLPRIKEAKKEEDEWERLLAILSKNGPWSLSQSSIGIDYKLIGVELWQCSNGFYRHKAVVAITWIVFIVQVLAAVFEKTWSPDLDLIMWLFGQTWLDLDFMSARYDQTWLDLDFHFARLRQT